MIHAFFLALGQLSDRPVLRVLLKSLVLTLLLFAGLGVGLWFAMDWLAGAAGEWLGHGAVEAKHYPAAHAAARDVPLGRSITMGVGSAARTIGYNLLLAPIYLMLLVTGVGTALAFFLVNAWLLGRDLGDMVAARHMPYAQLGEWRRQTRLRRLALGAIGTGLFLVPLINLVAPVLGAAIATHVFHRGRDA